MKNLFSIKKLILTTVYMILFYVVGMFQSYIIFYIPIIFFIILLIPEKTENEYSRNGENTINTPIILKSILHTWPAYTLFRALFVFITSILLALLQSPILGPDPDNYGVLILIYTIILIPSLFVVSLLSFFVALISLYTNIHIPFKIWEFIRKYWKYAISILIIGFTILIYFEIETIKQIEQQKIIREMEKNDEPEIAKVITDAIPDLPSTYIRYLQIIESDVKGYYTTIVDFYDFNLIVELYKKDSGSWIYFKSYNRSNEAVACSEFNTTDLRNAYKGRQCYREDGETGVVE